MIYSISCEIICSPKHRLLQRVDIPFHAQDSCKFRPLRLGPTGHPLHVKLNPIKVNYCPNNPTRGQNSAPCRHKIKSGVLNEDTPEDRGRGGDWTRVTRPANRENGDAWTWTMSRACTNPRSIQPRCFPTGSSHGFVQSGAKGVAHLWGGPWGIGAYGTPSGRHRPRVDDSRRVIGVRGQRRIETTVTASVHLFVAWVCWEGPDP